MHLYHLWNTLLAAAFIVAGVAVGWVVWGSNQRLVEVNVPFEVPGPTVERETIRMVPGPERIIIREVDRAVRPGEERDSSCDMERPRGKGKPDKGKVIRKPGPNKSKVIKKSSGAKKPRKPPRSITPPAPREGQRWTLDEFEERNRARTHARIQQSIQGEQSWQTQ
jgi:hypothetical protein